MLPIKTSGDFLSVIRFPYSRILTLFMRYLGTLNIANFRTQNLNENKNSGVYTNIVVQQ